MPPETYLLDDRLFGRNCRRDWLRLWRLYGLRGNALRCRYSIVIRKDVVKPAKIVILLTRTDLFLFRFPGW